MKPRKQVKVPRRSTRGPKVNHHVRGGGRSWHKFITRKKKRPQKTVAPRDSDAKIKAKMKALNDEFKKNMARIKNKKANKYKIKKLRGALHRGLQALKK